jgi:hypothetical protein
LTSQLWNLFLPQMHKVLRRHNSRAEPFLNLKIDLNPMIHNLCGQRTSCVKIIWQEGHGLQTVIDLTTKRDNRGFQTLNVANTTGTYWSVTAPAG